MRTYTFCLIVLLVSGCAKDWAAMREQRIDTAQTQYASAGVPVSSIAALPIVRFKDDSATVDVDATATFAVFTTGNSFAASIELPNYSRSDRLRVKSVLVGGSYIPATALLYPVVTFLDESKMELVAVDAPPKFFHSGLFGDLEGGGVDIIPIPQGARFAVIHSSPEHFGKYFSFSRTASTAMIGSMFISGATYEFSVPFVATGRVRISIVRASTP